MTGTKKNTFESLKEGVVENKLRSVGFLWLSGLAGSIAYNWSRPNMKTSVKIIHARLHAQALTLAALAGAAVIECYGHNSGQKAKYYEHNSKRVPKYLPYETHSQKD